MVQKNCINKTLVICGPTASGKTALSVELAKRLETEVVSADSLYIYKGLNIGTAKPDLKEMQGVKHHLIDVIEPTEAFSVSDYERLSAPIVDSLIAQNKIPVVCGGTGFYINSLLFDLSYGGVAENPEIREKYNVLSKEFGNEYVHNILREIDPKSAEEIHANNIKRVIRAIEIYEVSGRRKSEIDDSQKIKRNYNAFCIDYDRNVLYDRIAIRVKQMLKNGLIEEVETLLKNGVTKTSQCMQGIGYREVLEYLDNKITKQELEDLIILNTRHYAKRQITFFKRLPGLVSLVPDTLEKMADKVISSINS